MAREKKITVSARLNKEITGRHEDVSKGPLYPIYLNVNYDRKFTKFPYGSKYYSSSEFDKLVAENEIFLSHVNAIERMVRYEARRNPNFTLRGFGKKVKSYFSSFDSASYLAAAHYTMGELKGRLPYEDYINLLDESAIKQINFGLHNFEDNRLQQLQIMIGNAQFASTIWSNGLVLTWLLNYSKEELLRHVDFGLKSDSKNDLHGFERYLDKKTPQNEIIERLNTTAFYVIDNEIFIP